MGVDAMNSTSVRSQHTETVSVPISQQLLYFAATSLYWHSYATHMGCQHVMEPGDEIVVLKGPRYIHVRYSEEEELHFSLH